MTVPEWARPIRFASVARPRLDAKAVLIGATLLVLIYLVIGPLAMLLISSIKSTEGRLPLEPGTPLTLANYVQVFGNPDTYVLLLTTILFAVGSLAVGFFFAIALVWLVERTNLPYRNVVFVLVIASSALPGIIAGIAWVLLLNPVNGLVNVALRAVLGGGITRGPIDVFTIPGLILVQGLAIVPLTFLLLAAAFRAMDASYEEAASTSGARYTTVLRRVTLPLMTPAIFSALVYQLVTTIEAFDIPLVIGLRGGISVLSTQIYREVYLNPGLPNYGVASTYGILMLALAVVPLVLYNRVIARSPSRFATISGRGYRPRRVDLGRWRWPALAAVLLFLFVTFVLPFLVMVWMSVQPFYAVPSEASIRRITFDAYRTIWADTRTVTAIVNTLILGVGAGLGAMLIALVTSWTLVRSKTRFKVLLDLLSFAPHAFPGVIIGLSIALIYLMLPMPIYGTIWIIIIALMTQYISLGTRLMNAGVAQVHVELEEAAETSGATWSRTIRQILLPLLIPAFLNGFLLIFLASIKNLTLSLMLYSSDSVVLSALIFQRWDIGDTAPTAVLGVIMSIVTVGLAILLRRYGAYGR